MVKWYRLHLPMQETQVRFLVQKIPHTDTETKHHTRANKFQGKTYQANSPATRNTGDLVEKKESPKGERAVQPVISLPSEKWVLKIGFLKVQNW